MKRSGNVVHVFVVFFLISLLFFFFAYKGIAGFLQNVTVPVQKVIFTAFNKPAENKTEVEKLREENSRLLTELAKQKELEKENRALRDQFETEKISSRKLLPADVIGAGNNTIIIDRGEDDGVKVGDVIVVKDNVIGQVSKTSPHVSVVQLILFIDKPLAAKTVKTRVLGIVRSSSGKIVLDNVVLSDKLEQNDLVVTKGDVDEKGAGFPPDLVIGKITSINKRASALFQRAEVKSLVDMAKLETVFVIVGK